MTMNKILKYAAIAGAVVAIGIQFIRPERTNPGIEPLNNLLAQTSLPGDVRATVESSCFDCHSNLTRWPWYSEVAPASWLVSYDVREGRKHLNFSEWGGYSVAARVAKLEGLMSEIEAGSMPPGLYVMMHGDADLSAEKQKAVLDWAKALRDSLDDGSNHDN